MFNRTQGAAPALVKVGPTSLLTLVAGDFASAVDRLWPTPHAPFVTAPAARRHLVCLALALGVRDRALHERLLTERLRRAIPAAVGEAPAGLERALGRMGEVAWAAADYRILLRVLAAPRAAKALRHATVIEAAVVRRLAALPGPMAEAAHLALELTDDGVAALREAYAALRLRSGEAPALAAAARWARSGSARAMFEAVRDDLAPEPLAPPHPGTPRLRPLGSKAEIRSVARRFRNCLADRVPHAVTGWSAYYLWEGPPAGVVEVTRDHIFGWRLEEARLAENAAVPEPVRDAIAGELALMGVHVGRSGWELDRALSVDVGRTYVLRPAEEVLAEAFGE